MGLIAHIGMMSTSKPYERVTEDPEKILEQSINDMQEDLARLRQAVAELIAALKLQEEQYNESATQAQECEKRAILAIQKGEKNLARELLSRKKTHADLAATLKAGLDQQSGQVELLKKNWIAIESKISEAKTKKEMLKAQFLQAKNQENLNNIAREFDFSEDNLDSSFARLEVDDVSAAELAASSAKMMTSSPEPEGALPPSDTSIKPSVDEAIADEIESLRRQMHLS